MEPRSYAWIVPGRLAVAERPGGGGRAHRAARRAAEQAWWWDQGVRTVVSCMPTRHGLLEHALDGFAIRWHPLADAETAPEALARMAEDVLGRVDGVSPPVLVHGDTPGEWLTAVDAALRLALAGDGRGDEALAAAAADGFPVGPLAEGLVLATADALPPSPAAV